MPLPDFSLGGGVVPDGGFFTVFVGVGGDVLGGRGTESAGLSAGAGATVAVAVGVTELGAEEGVASVVVAGGVGSAVMVGGGTTGSGIVGGSSEAELPSSA
jgi:hypothetical protein